MTAPLRVPAGPAPAAPAARRTDTLRLLVFEDSVYRQEAGEVFTDQSFLWFVTHLAPRTRTLELLGRLDPVPGRSHYRLPDGVRLVPLPHYASLARVSALPQLLRSLAVAWSALGRADVVWLLGPHPLAVVLVLLARLRGTRVVLGVRQDLPTYARRRHPDRPAAHRAADLLEALWRRLGRTRPVVVVGPDLDHAYRACPRRLATGISLVRRADLGAPPARDWDGVRQLLSVGRLEEEKNPLLLADVLATLLRHDPRWRLVVCGEGPLEGALRDRLRALGVEGAAELRGYVPVDRGLREVYASSHALLHVSWTEGVPQVLFEAWAAGLPVVATDVGGVRAASRGAALLVAPGQAGETASALERLADDGVLRARLVEAGTARARESTVEAVTARLWRFLADQGAPACAA